MTEDIQSDTNKESTLIVDEVKARKEQEDIEIHKRFEAVETIVTNRFIDRIARERRNKEKKPVMLGDLF